MIHPDLVRLEECLKTMDWYYDYSDDHGVWKRGRDKAEEIRQLRNICCGLGLDHIAEELYKKYCPF